MYFIIIELVSIFHYFFKFLIRSLYFLNVLIFNPFEYNVIKWITMW